jgi:hypothetical protein
MLITVDGALWLVLRTEEKHGGWVALYARPTPSDVAGPHACFTVPALWWQNGAPQGSVRTSGHTFARAKESLSCAD